LSYPIICSPVSIQVINKPKIFNIFSWKKPSKKSLTTAEFLRYSEEMSDDDDEVHVCIGLDESLPDDKEIVRIIKPKFYKVYLVL
jgi:hypothetical protein